jgi:hypothetical protein
MGLDFYTDEIPYAEDLSFTERAHWSYSGFNRFRARLVASELGLNLGQMQGFGGTTPWDENHPLTPFLDHSDCDGTLSAEDCQTVAPALSSAIKDWSDDDYDKVMGLKLVNHMLTCVELNRALVFA